MQELNKEKSKKLRTALLSIGVSSLLILLKLAFGFLTNAISIFASALDSFLDLGASSINYFSIRKAEKPADKEHPFGHGKAESLAGLFQGAVVGGSGIYLIYKSVERVAFGASVTFLNYGIVVMIITIVISFFLSRHLKRVGQETDSLALRADSLHYSSDVLTGMGVLAGLLVIRFTGIIFIDSVVSILVACYIIWSTAGVFKESIDTVMDRELSRETVNEVREAILTHKPVVKGFHKLRTRRAGNKRFIEFHLILDSSLSFIDSHDLAERIIKDIEKKVPNADVTVHVDPHGVPDYS